MNLSDNKCHKIIYCLLIQIDLYYARDYTRKRYQEFYPKRIMT